MTYDLQKIIASKQRYRVQLAARPIAEKLAMLDQLRERVLEIRAAAREVPLIPDAAITPAASSRPPTPP